MDFFSFMQRIRVSGQEHTVDQNFRQIVNPNKYLDSTGRNDMSSPLHQGFSTAAPQYFGRDHSFSGRYSGTSEYLAASVASVHQMPVSVSLPVVTVKTSPDLVKYSLRGQNYSSFCIYRRFHLLQFSSYHFLQSALVPEMLAQSLYFGPSTQCHLSFA